jgi:uncharacterized protein YaiE (UPF0345 family)
MPKAAEQFAGVTVTAKANIYFDGKVASHSVQMPDGAKKMLGLIYPGRFHFNTQAAEQMDIVAGECRVALDGGGEEKSYAAGESFYVPANSGFNIAVEKGICEYICSFVK